MDQEYFGSRVSNLEAQLCSQEARISGGVEKTGQSEMSYNSDGEGKDIGVVSIEPSR